MIIAVTAGACALAALPVGGSLSRWLPRRALRGPRLVVAVVAGLLGAGSAAVGIRGPALVGYAALAVALAGLLVVDALGQRLPDPLVGGALVVLAAALALNAGLQGADGWRRFGVAALTGLVIMVGYFGLAWLRPADLGLGDVKLAGLLGLALGWWSPQTALLGALAGFGCGAATALVLLVARRVDRRGHFPFGPCMIAGAVLAVLAATLGPGLATG